MRITINRRSWKCFIWIIVHSENRIFNYIIGEETRKTNLEKLILMFLIDNGTYINGMCSILAPLTLVLLEVLVNGNSDFDIEKFLKEECDTNIEKLMKPFNNSIERYENNKSSLSLAYDNERENYILVYAVKKGDNKHLIKNNKLEDELIKDDCYTFTLNKVKCVINCGADNDYSHLHYSILKRKNPSEENSLDVNNNLIKGKSFIEFMIFFLPM
ncbi:hypothetical protein H8356DRAFT_1321127 [Neocallimastix lanati (nom. inval.)]|nr:hypothetical protein H8356DRAFT_1321127 [Neocallimastix sp. JGI-2020a]